MSGPAPGIAMYENTRNDPVAAWPYDARNDPRYCNVQRRSERPTAPRGSATPETSSVLRGARRHPERFPVPRDAKTPETSSVLRGRDDARNAPRCYGARRRLHRYFDKKISFLRTESVLSHAGCRGSSGSSRSVAFCGSAGSPALRRDTHGSHEIYDFAYTL